MHRLEQLKKKKTRVAIGLMSGTSVDSIDAALVQITGNGPATKIKLLEYISYPYPPGLKDEIVSVSTPGKGSVDQICRINVILGEIFASAALALIEKSTLKRNKIDFVASHGQTVHHLPYAADKYGFSSRSTLQLGEASVIAKRTGIVTVADFRPADLALGGQGAPLVPYFDYILFGNRDRNVGLLNIGGIANITVLRRKGRLKDVKAFDTGPGNMVIDAVVKSLYERSFDENGQLAASGAVDDRLLDVALEHDYFQQSPPKSTGREEFGEAFCRSLLAAGADLGVTAPDLVATVTELTAQSIWNSYDRFVAPETPLQEVIVSGGGTENAFLMSSLQQHFGEIPISRIDEHGIPSDAKEAICFAVLGNETLSGNPNNVPAATGASQPTILGKICL